MLTLLADDHFEEIQARRRAWGADKLDEVWSGIHHLQPVGPHSTLQQAIALRLRPVATQRGLVPVLGAYDPRQSADRGLSDVGSPRLRGDQAATAVLAVEIDTRAEDMHRRLSVCAADHVSEVAIIDLESRTVGWFALVGGQHEPIGRSRLIDCSPARLAEMIEWPEPGGA